MGTLPERISYGTTVTPGVYPTRTWRMDSSTGRLAGFCDGLEAMAQAVDAALHVRRFHWQIYTPNAGHQIEVVGADYAIAQVNLQVQIKDALLADDRITGVSDFSFTQKGDAMEASFLVHTLFGTLSAEVSL